MWNKYILTQEQRISRKRDSEETNSPVEKWVQVHNKRESRDRFRIVFDFLLINLWGVLFYVGVVGLVGDS